MTIRSLKDLVDAELNGQTFFGTFRKTPNVATGASVWFDLGMSPGNPMPNVYSGDLYTATAMSFSGINAVGDGIRHGGNVGQLGFTKYLKTWGMLTVTAAAVPLPMILCDYLLFYQGIDMSISPNAFTPLVNNVTLPRYTNGRGVQMIAILQIAHSGAGNPQFQVQYTNDVGVTGRVTPPIAVGTQIVQGTIVNTATATARCVGPFITLQAGDMGVRKIEAIKFITPDTGILALMLVMPIENSIIRTIDAAVERNSFQDFGDTPIISDDAVLNILCLPSGSLSAAPLHGYLQTVWG